MGKKVPGHCRRNGPSVLIGAPFAHVVQGLVPFIPDLELRVEEEPDCVLRAALSDSPDVVVTTLGYDTDRQEGFWIFRMLCGYHGRLVLWDQYAGIPCIAYTARQWGAEVLGPSQLASLVGMCVSRAPLSGARDVLIYAPQDTVNVQFALEATLDALGEEKIEIVSDEERLDEELCSGRYGLVCDTSLFDWTGGFPHGQVVKNLVTMKLETVPRVAVFTQPYPLEHSLVAEILGFWSLQEQFSCPLDMAPVEELAFIDEMTPEDVQ